MPNPGIVPKAEPAVLLVVPEVQVVQEIVDAAAGAAASVSPNAIVHTITERRELYTPVIATLLV
jgi:hypothetical protein